MGIALTVVLLAAAAGGEPTPLSLDQAVARALAQHPSLRASSADEQAAAARANLAAAGELPHADASLELVAGTGNVLRGAQYPLRGIPAVTGPPQPASLGDAA